MIAQFDVEIKNSKSRDILSKLKPAFYKSIHTNKKAKDCLEALELVEKNKPIPCLLAVRLLGQIPDTNPLYKWLYDELSPQFKSNGFVLIDENGSLSVVPDDPFFMNLFRHCQQLPKPKGKL